MKKVSRRNFFALAAGAAAGAAVQGNAAQQQPASKMAMPMDEAPPLPLQPGEENFVPDLTLEPQWIIKEFEGKKVKVRAYNGQIPGPLIKSKAGVTLKIRVENKLTPYDSSAWGGNMNVPHMLDHTNLHLHGPLTLRHMPSSRWAQGAMSPRP